MGVLTSVPGALVFKRAGYTHHDTHTEEGSAYRYRHKRVTAGSPQGGWHSGYYLFSLPVCLPTATLRVLCYFSNTGLQPGAWTISQAMPTEGAGSAHRLRAWLFADGLPNDAYMQLQTGPLLPPPLCITMYMHTCAPFSLSSLFVTHDFYRACTAGFPTS